MWRTQQQEMTEHTLVVMVINLKKTMRLRGALKQARSVPKHDGQKQCFSIYSSKTGTGERATERSDADVLHL